MRRTFRRYVWVGLGQLLREGHRGGCGDGSGSQMERQMNFTVPKHAWHMWQHREPYCLLKKLGRVRRSTRYHWRPSPSNFKFNFKYWLRQLRASNTGFQSQKNTANCTGCIDQEIIEEYLQVDSSLSKRSSWSQKKALCQENGRNTTRAKRKRQQNT